MILIRGNCVGKHDDCSPQGSVRVYVTPPILKSNLHCIVSPLEKEIPPSTSLYLRPAAVLSLFNAASLCSIHPRGRVGGGGEKEGGEERKEIEKEARAAWSVTGIEDRGRMIARKHVIRSSFSAAVSLLLIGVGHCMLVKRRGQVSPATVATRIISGRRGPTPVFFHYLTGRSRGSRVTWFESPLDAVMVKICQQWGIFGQKLLLTEKQRNPFTTIITQRKIESWRMALFRYVN